MAIRAPRTWWKGRGFFDPEFYTPAGPIHREAAKREVRFLSRHLKLKKGSEVLDLCCGPGRHSLLLAWKGCRVTGVDYSLPYLRQARERARRERVAARFLRGDMKKLKFVSKFDAAFNVFTSFGYFARKSDNDKVIRGVARALKPGGLFLMDVINGAWLRKHFSPRSWHREGGGSYWLEERELGPGQKRILTKWIRIFPNGRVMERSFFLWLYDRKSISALLRRSGLEPLRFWGSLRGKRLSDKTNRLVVLARKV